MQIGELIPCGIYSLRPPIFNRKAVLSLVKCAPKWGVEFTYNSLEFFLFFAYHQGNKESKECGH